MFRSTKINLLLLPVLMLICLSCPVKQEIKQFLGIPIQQQIEKGSSSKTCVLFASQRAKVSKASQLVERTDFTPFGSSSYWHSFPLATSLALDKRTELYRNLLPKEPLFITYRQLII